MEKKCIIFDLDGTLIDSRRDLATATNMMREHYGLPPLSVDVVTSYIGNGAAKQAERALKEYPEFDLDEATELLRKFYRENMLAETAFYPGVYEGLENLHSSGWAMAVVTNKPDEHTKAILKHLQVDRCFDFIIGGGSSFPLKPDPAAMNFILENSGSEAESSWMLGDNYTDLEAGKNAAMKTCFAAYGFGDPKDSSYDLKVDSFSEFSTALIECI